MTLEQVRRYTAELGFQPSPDDEAEVWHLFDQQTLEGRKHMIKQFQRVARGGFDVLEEAQDWST